MSSSCLVLVGWILGNNAGTEGTPGPVTEQTAETYAVTFDTNVLRNTTEHEARIEGDAGTGERELLLDLKQLNLVDVEVVRFLGTCQAQGVTLANCSPYIRDWIAKEKD